MRSAGTSPSRNGRGPSGLGRRRGNVLDDEECLPRPDETQLSPRQFLDGVGILAEPPRLLAQPGVFRAFPANRRRQFVVPAARPQRRQQPAFADQSVHHDDHGDKHEEQVDEAAGSSGVSGLDGSTFWRKSALALRHRTDTVQQRE
jgi:hypothetical protein